MIEVLQASQAHAGVMAEIHAQAADDPWDEGFLADLLGKPGVSALLAVDGGKQPTNQPIGFVLTRQVADEAEVLFIATVPTARRQGAGKTLLVTVSKQLAMAGAAHLHLEVAADNAPAQALYRGAGFEVVGRRPGYYRRGEGTVDAVLMRLNLVEAGGRTKYKEPTSDS